MLKGKNNLYPNAIVDFNLKILDSNSFFNDFFQSKKDWDKLSVKITDLIEFDNLNEFKESLNSIQALGDSNSIFNGKVKIGEQSELIKVTVNHIQNEDQKWSNKAVEITCQRIENFPFPPNFPKILFENSPIRMFIVDRNYDLTFFNNSAIPLLEFILERTPIPGNSFLLVEQDSEEWKNYFDIVFSDETMVLEKNYQKDEIEYYDMLTLSPLKSESGSIDGCIVYANDILNLKKVEIQHYQNHKKYQHIFDHNILGICVLDENNILMQANDSFCRLAGIENNNFDEIRATDFFHGEDYDLLISKLKQFYKKEISNYTCELKLKNNRQEVKYIQVGMNGLYEKDKYSGCLFSVLNISSQREFQINEQELKELKTKENLNLEYQRLLQKEIDSRIRELASNQMLIAQKNNLIKDVCKKLERLAQKSDLKIRSEIRKIISSINHQNIFADDWENLKIHFVKMHPSFFDTITARSPKITQNELRHCAYVRLGFSAKETSDLLGTLPRSIEQARFRIKKKLELPHDQKLIDYLRSI